MTTDNILHIIEILVVGAPIWGVAFRLTSIIKDFPPHRHANGNIIYPKGFEPSEVQVMFKDHR